MVLARAKGANIEIELRGVVHYLIANPIATQDALAV
jgi:hypothetical protein